MKDKLRVIAPLVILLVLVAAFLLPKYLENKALSAFGAPLFSYALPEDTTLVQQDAAKDDAGGWTAALLLESSLTEEELSAYYAAVDAPPAEEGYSVELSVKPLDEDSIEAMKQAKLYEEGKSYYFVYLYSAP